jgi:hypothetical protein
MVETTDHPRCYGPRCSEPAERQGLCWGHMKQKQRGQELRPIVSSPEGRVIEIGSEMLEAEDDGEWDNARIRFLRAAEAMMRALGWRPPMVRERAGEAPWVQLPLPLKEPRKHRLLQSQPQTCPRQGIGCP